MKNNNINNPWIRAFDYLESQGHERPSLKHIIVDTDHFKRKYKSFINEMKKLEKDTKN